MSLADRVAQIRANEYLKRSNEEILSKPVEESGNKDQTSTGEAQIAIASNTKRMLALLDITDARGLIREARGIWGVGEIHESRHIKDLLHQSSASVSLSHHYLELEPLYRGTRDEGTDIGPRTGTRIFKSGVSLSISVHESGYKGRPHAIVSYDKYQMTYGVDFPQLPQRGSPLYRQTAENPWGEPTGGNTRASRPLIYGLPWIEIILEDPKRTRDEVELLLARILNQCGSPAESERLQKEIIAKDPFVQRSRR